MAVMGSEVHHALEYCNPLVDHSDVGSTVFGERVPKVLSWAFSYILCLCQLGLLQYSNSTRRPYLIMVRLYSRARNPPLLMDLQNVVVTVPPPYGVPTAPVQRYLSAYDLIHSICPKSIGRRLGCEVIRWPNPTSG
jgi:hypothetical protein